MGVDSTTGIDIETINGSVDLTFGSNVSANLKVETTNGKIIDENLYMSNRNARENLKADIGTNPSTSVSVSTVNGRVTLKGKRKELGIKCDNKQRQTKSWKTPENFGEH